MGRPLTGKSAAEAAERALAAALSSPVEAAEQAQQAVDLARRAGDHGAQSVAERAWGLALREQRDLSGSLQHLRHAVRGAEVAGLSRLAADARLSLMGTLAMAGRTAAALAEGERARSQLDGVDGARLDVQEAGVLVYRGQVGDALPLYGRALPVLREARDRLWLSRLHNGRGLALASRGDTEGAIADLTEAERLLTELGEERAAAAVRQNLGFAAAFAGDLPAALRWFDQADEWFRARGEVDTVGLYDRCRALLAARLLEEARTTAEEAAAALHKQGLGTYASEARLLAAEAALAAGDAAEARETAAEARRSFVRQRRQSWAALARSVEVQAAWEAGDRSRRLLADARRAADALECTGWPVRAADARLIAARIALASGLSDVARQELRAAAGARTRGPADLRARAWEATALSQAAAGDHAGALRSARAGLRVVDEHRAAFGATELRAAAAAHGDRLAHLGLRLAVEKGRAAAVLDWAERRRALSMLPVRQEVPDDELLAADLAELRTVARTHEAALLAGVDTTRPAARRVALEAAVRRRSRHATGAVETVASPPSLRALGPVLGVRALVEFLDVDGRLHAVTVVDGRARLWALGSAVEVGRELDGARFALQRLARGRGSADAARTALLHAGTRLDALLLAPMADVLGDRPLVLVPTGALHGVPWAVVASCAEGRRTVTVAPSAAAWLRAEQQGDADGDVVLVAGPGLDHAVGEVTSVRRHYDRSTVFTGRRARAAAVADALASARLAHVAAHGRFRRDNPLLSSLLMDDGPLTVYDLERLHRAPGTLVLSACDSGVSSVHAGDELLGLAAALLRLGTRAVVAGMVPVPDEGTRLLMQAFHRSVAAGLRPAAALAEAQRLAADRGGSMATAAAAFVCFGAG